jgi:hypothetical protein
MIVRIAGYGGRTEYVALHVDERSRDVWVPVRGDRGRNGEISADAALRLCIQDVQAHVGPLIEDASKLYRLCDVRSRTRSDEEDRRMRALAHHVADTLALTGVNLLRLADEPTAEDQVDIDAEYVTRPASALPGQ